MEGGKRKILIHSGSQRDSLWIVEKRRTLTKGNNKGDASVSLANRNKQKREK
jgi:hypothetical protein